MSLGASLGARLAALFRRPQAPLPAVPAAPLFGPVKQAQAAPDPLGPAGAACFGVSTARGTWVSAAPGVLHLGTAPVLDPAHAVLAIVPDALRRVCVLVAPDLREIRVHGDAMPGIAVSARALPTNVDRVVRLRYPLGAPAFLTLREQPGKPAELRFAGDGNTLDATFKLVPVPPDRVPAASAALAHEIGTACATGLRAAPLLAAWRSGAVRLGLVEALLRMMPPDELAELARIVLDQPAERALLRQAMPGDAWVDRCLPTLAAWHAARGPVGEGGQARSPASDEAALLPASGAGVMPAGMALQTLARRLVMPRRGACLLAAARNEGVYLLDWISYHLSVGFEHVFLYVNENDDGSDELLSALSRAGVVTLIRNERTPAIGPQLKGYAHALTMLPHILEYRWAAVLDVDEFFVFDADVYAGIGDFMAVQEAQPVDAVALCWAMFAGLPGDRWNAQSTLERFTRRTREVNHHVKSVIRTRLFWYMQPHFPTAALDLPFVFRRPDGSVHHHPEAGRSAAFAVNPSADQAWINHYLLRSADEALWKWARGRGDLAGSNPESLRPLDFIAGNFLDLARPELLVEDRRVLACARGQAAVLDGLRRLPGVAACEESVAAQFAGQLRLVRERFLAMALPPDVSPNVRAFRRIVEEG